MPTTSPPTHADSWPRRDECLAAIDRDGFTILPHLLPQDMIDREERDHPRYTETNIVEHDPVFREFLLYLPALQLSYDVFGPMFHLGQDKWTRKFRADEGMSLNWHSDGPLGFPEIDGRCPLHTLRFGYFMSDITHDDSGTLEEIRSNSRCGGGRAAAIAGGSAAKPTPLK